MRYEADQNPLIIANSFISPTVFFFANIVVSSKVNDI